jgi:hypothetical protein
MREGGAWTARSMLQNERGGRMDEPCEHNEDEDDQHNEPSVS